MDIWNSLETASTIRTTAQWIVAIFGIIALIFTIRTTTLKNKKDTGNINELANATIRYKYIIEQISIYDRSALDKALEIQHTSPNSITGKYLGQIINEKGLEFERFLMENEEGKLLFGNFTGAYFKDVKSDEVKKRREIAIHQIKTSNHLLEVTWGFLALRNLGYSDIQVFDFDRTDTIK